MIFYKKKPKRKSRANLKMVKQKYYLTELIHKFSNLTLRSQTLANIIEIFQNIYHVDLYFTEWRCELYLHTLQPPYNFSAKAYS